MIIFQTSFVFQINLLFQTFKKKKYMFFLIITIYLNLLFINPPTIKRMSLLLL